MPGLEGEATLPYKTTQELFFSPQGSLREDKGKMGGGRWREAGGSGGGQCGQRLKDHRCSSVGLKWCHSD